MSALDEYKPIPHDSDDLYWEVLSTGTGGGCIHAEVTSIVWFSGAGGPLVEVECKQCRRKLRERLTLRSPSWPRADR